MTKDSARGVTQAPNRDFENPDLTIALAAAHLGAQAVRVTPRRSASVSFKGDADPVTDADHRSQQVIVKYLRDHRPDDVLVTEEATSQATLRQGRVWLIDPLDGTTNYLHGFPWMAVSVALWVDDAPSVGVVVDISTGDEYAAVAGHGAWRNGSALEVSATPDLGKALIVTGFPYDRSERAEICDTSFRRVLGAAQGVRRLGAASLDLCMVAAGKLDGYWEEDLSPWDMGAGVLMVTEAGGRVTCQDGQPISASTPFVVAGNGRIHPQFLETLRGPRLS